MFAKQLPKILEGLGIKLDGDGKFTLNPLRKMENEMAGGKFLKKPNDMLARAGKAIMKSPVTGMSLLGKKTIGGIDAKRHGKSFKQGWDRTHGKLYNNFYKKLDEWAPDSAEARKNERLGREEVKMMNTKWTKGDEIRTKLKSTGKDFKHLDGTDAGVYSTAGFNGEFLKSKMNLDRATEEQKILNRIYQARQMGTSLEDAIAQESSNIEKYKLDVSRFNSDTKLYKEVDATNKKVSGMEKVHESIRKMNPNQADIEDAIKFVKYNEIDPTDPTRISKGLDEGDDSPNIDLHSPESSHSVVDSSTDSQSIIDRVNDVTGVSRGAATENGATTGAIVESIMEEIRKEMEAVKQIHDTTTDRDEMVKSAEKLKELEKELEDIRRRNS